MSFLRRSKIESKTPTQIHLMRAAGLVVADTLQLARTLSVAGTSTLEIDTAAERSIRAAGAVPSFKGYYGFPGSVCISVNDEVVHGIPGARVLAEGDLVSIDCGAIVQGWHGDAALSLIVGGTDGPSARPDDVALLHDTEASMWAGIGALVPGERLFGVGEAVQASIEQAHARRAAQGQALTYGIVEDFVGHGIGTSMHMDPSVPNYAVEGKGPLLPVGATLAIEPMVTLGTIETRTLDDEWTVVTTDGSRAAHWEHTVAITESGVWVLTARDGGASSLGGGAAYAPLA
ncbi:MAG: type I methionyl aminopeptidase [Ornithinimicrobium sp.]